MGKKSRYEDCTFYTFLVVLTHSAAWPTDSVLGLKREHSIWRNIGTEHMGVCCLVTFNSSHWGTRDKRVLLIFNKLQKFPAYVSVPGALWTTCLRWSFFPEDQGKWWGKEQEISSHTYLLTSCVTRTLPSSGSLSLSFFSWKMRLILPPDSWDYLRTKYNNACENQFAECQLLLKYCKEW